MPKKAHGELNAKQRKFVLAYAGNGTEAARAAGWRGDDRTLAVTASQLLRNPKVIEAIKAREVKELRPAIMSRQERQAFWSAIARGEDGDGEMQHRLKASELLGKSEGDFLDRLKVEGDIRIVVENPFSHEMPTPKPTGPALESPPVEPMPPDEEHIPDPEEH